MDQITLVERIEEKLGELELIQAMAEKIDETAEHSADNSTAEEIQTEIKATARKILEDTTDYLEEKKATQGLEEWETVLLERCKSTVHQTNQPLRGPIALTVFGLGKLINLGAFLYEKYTVSEEQKIALKQIEAEGQMVMPLYQKSIIEDLVQLAVFYAVGDQEIFEQAKEMLDRAQIIGNFYRKKACFTLNEGAVLLKVAEYAYSGMTGSGAIQKMEASSLPEEIRCFYQETTGLFDIPGGLKAFFGKWNGNVVIGFAGTDIKTKIPTLGADIQQLVSPSLMYLRAAGIVKMMADKFEGAEIIVVGHSLGGGLTQLAVLANGANTRIRGAAFNSAGLSLLTMDETDEELAGKKVESVSTRITHFRAKLDPVSAFGALIGGVITLENATFPYHCISNIKHCFGD